MDDKLDIRYVAGLIDADGSLCISISDSRSKTNCVTFGWIINFRSIHEFVTRRVHATFGCGRVYYSNRFNEQRTGIWSWQTVRLQDTLKVAKRLQPYLVIKAQTCQLFIDALSEWIETAPRLNGGRKRQFVVRPREVVEKAFDVALNLNKCTRTKTARDNKVNRIEAMRANIISFYGDKAV